MLTIKFECSFLSWFLFNFLYDPTLLMSLDFQRSRTFLFSTVFFWNLLKSVIISILVNLSTFFFIFLFFIFLFFFHFFYFRSLERCLSCSLIGPPVSVFQGDTSNSESPMTPINPWFFKCVNLSIFLYCHGQYFLSILLEDSLDVKYHNYRQQMIDLHCFDNWLFQINSGR